MAVVMRRRRIANPAGERRRLSLRQKLFFGSKRQRASAAISLKRRRTNRGGLNKAKHRFMREGYSPRGLSTRY